MHRTSLASLIFITSLQLCYSRQITFSDSQIFVDLSTFNFNNGQNPVQEWSLTARDGNVVQLYLFQNNSNQYTIQLFDGPDGTARMIPTEGRIPSTDQLFIEPASIRSSGSSMYIRVSADTTDPTAVVDFQALATDYARPAGCSSTAISINQKDTLVVNHSFVANQDTPCYYVIHANDPTNNPLLVQNVQISDQLNTGWFTLYKGLLMDDKHILVYNNLLSATSAYDKYLIVAPTQTSRLSFDYSFMATLDLTLQLRQYTHGTIMSNDYYKDSYPNENGAMKQNIVIEKILPAKVFQITFLNMMGPGTLTIAEITNNVTMDETVYLPATFHTAFNNTYDCDKVVLKYSTKMRPQSGASGFYAVYDDATDYTVYPSTTPGPITTTGKQSTQSKTTDNTVPPTTTSSKLATSTKATESSKASIPPVNPSTSPQPSTTNANPSSANTQSTAPVSTGSVETSSSTKPITQRPIITTQSPEITTKAVAYKNNLVIVLLISFVILL